MNFSSSRFRILALVFGFALVVVGVLFLRGGGTAPGLGLIAIGVAAYLWASMRIQQETISFEDIDDLRKYLGPATLAFLSAICVLSAIFLMSEPQDNSLIFYAVDALWVAGVLLVLGAAVWGDHVHLPSRQRIREIWVAHRTELLLLAGILLVASLARTVDLSVHPYPWSGDEASVGLEARRILAGGVTNFFDTGWSGQPNWSFVPTAISFLLFGSNIIGIRMVSAVAGILAVLFVYLLGREMFNGKVGLLAAAFLALYPINVHFSRVGVNNINDSFLVVFVLWSVFRAARRQRSFDYVVAGVATGLTIYTYVGSRLVLLMAIGTLVYMAIAKRGFLRSQYKGLLAYLGAAVLTAAPMALFFYQHPDIFITRIGQEGILFNGWLGRHAVETGQSVFAVLVDQFAALDTGLRGSRRHRHVLQLAPPLPDHARHHPGFVGTGICLRAPAPPAQRDPAGLVLVGGHPGRGAYLKPALQYAFGDDCTGSGDVRGAGRLAAQ